MLPLSAYAIAWWPRQTPSKGILDLIHSLTNLTLIPALLGSPGPGEITNPFGSRSISSLITALSFLITLTSCPKSPRKWYKFQVKLS